MMVRSSSLKTKIRSLSLKVARLRPLQPLVTLFMQHMDLFLPSDRLGENAHWMAFHHPQPDYPLHILILPKQAIPSLSAAPGDVPALYADLFLIVQALIKVFQLEAHAYRLITNGGQNQSIPLWHWHLVCEASCKGSEHPGD